jgi:hypothetical protein
VAKKKTKKPSWVVLAGILLILSVTGGYFGFKQFFPYYGWETLYLETEGATIRYPKHWGFEHIVENQGGKCAYDFANFYNVEEGSVRMSVQNSYEYNIFAEDFIAFDEINALGGNYQIGFVPYLDGQPSKPGDKVANAYLIGKQPVGDSYNAPPTRQQNSCPDTRALIFDMMYVPGQDVGQEEVELETFKNDPNYETVKKIIESVTYDD